MNLLCQPLLSPGERQAALATGLCNLDDIVLSNLMTIRSLPKRTEALTEFVQSSSRRRRRTARSLLTKKLFVEFKAVFNVHDSLCLAALRRLGGRVNGIPPVASVYIQVRATDSGLSLLHWAVGYWREFPDLLSQPPWTSEDLCLTTSQGLTALHYAVLFDVGTLPLRKLLAIAGKCEVKGAWKKAGGVGVSPLHLAVMYDRDAIVDELLEFGWDPTEPMQSSPGCDAHDLMLLKAAAAKAASAPAADALLSRAQSMEQGQHRSAVELKLSSVVPVSDIFPATPHVYLVVFILFGLPCFFRPPILPTTLTGLENTVTDCVNPYNTEDPTRDGVLPWDCPVGFTEVGMPMKIFPNHGDATAPAKMQSYPAFLEKADLSRGVTHLPWTHLRFATVVDDMGMKEATSLSDADVPPSSSHKYWVFTELRKFQQWPTEVHEQRNPGAKDSLVMFRAETTRTFHHTVIPYGFGDHMVMVIWLGVITVVVIAALLGFLVNLKRFIVSQSDLLMELSTPQKSTQVMWLACEVTAVGCAAIGVASMASVFFEHSYRAVLDRGPVLEWQRAEVAFRLALIFSSLRTGKLINVMPQRQYFHVTDAVAAIAAGVMIVVLVALLPAWRVEDATWWAWSDVLTVPLALGASLHRRCSGMSDEVRQVHLENVRRRVEDAQQNQTTMVTVWARGRHIPCRTERAATMLPAVGLLLALVAAAVTIMRPLWTVTAPGGVPTAGRGFLELFPKSWPFS